MSIKLLEHIHHMLSSFINNFPHLQLTYSEFSNITWIWFFCPLLISEHVNSLLVFGDLITITIYLWTALIVTIKWFFYMELSPSKAWSLILPALDRFSVIFNWEHEFLCQVEHHRWRVTNNFTIIRRRKRPLSTSKPSNTIAVLHLK